MLNIFQIYKSFRQNQHEVLKLLLALNKKKREKELRFHLKWDFDYI